MLTHEREGWIRTRDAHVLAGPQGAWQPWPQEGALLGLLTHSCQGRIVGYVKTMLKWTGWVLFAGMYVWSWLFVGALILWVLGLLPGQDPPTIQCGVYSDCP